MGKNVLCLPFITLHNSTIYWNVFKFIKTFFCLGFLGLTGMNLSSGFDFRTTEVVAPVTTAAPVVQADNTATMETVMEVETAAAVISEEPQPQVTVNQTAEVKAAEAPVTSSESAVVTESTAR